MLKCEWMKFRYMHLRDKQGNDIEEKADEIYWIKEE